SYLARPDVDGAGTLFTGLGLVRDLGALGERPMAVSDDGAEVHEDVLRAVIGRDEPEALVVAKPLDGSCCHVFLPSARFCPPTQRMLVSNNNANAGPGGFRPVGPPGLVDPEFAQDGSSLA